jgi:hypothetical protein
MHDFHGTFSVLLHAANLHGTDGFTSPPKEGVLSIFFALKNPTTSAGFEPANLGTKGQHATPRPLKPLLMDLILCYNVESSDMSFTKHLLIAPTQCTMLIHYIHLLFPYIRFGIAFTIIRDIFCALLLKPHGVTQLLHYSFYSSNQ